MLAPIRRSRFASAYQCGEVGSDGRHFFHFGSVASQVLLRFPNQSNEMLKCGLKSAKPAIKCQSCETQKSRLTVGSNGHLSFAGPHSNRKKVPHEKACFFPPLQVCSSLL